jgi:ATP-dependent DNA helicase DinG
VPEVPAVSRVTELTDASVEAFAADGPLARALDGFEARAGQLEMAEAVASVLARGGVLLAEAGTGTGKTLAYLVPAILSRKRVLVSTGTKNLQEQIFFKDLPVLRDALGIPFTATCMKGRGNYLCLHRFDSFKDSAAIRSWDETRHLRILERWLPDTETGDRAEVEDLPEDLPFWNEISATSENCIGAECPRYNDCFVVKMRQRAAESDVVIVNHHLLCADAAVRQSNFGEVIPRCSNAIVDEAHQLEDVATQYFGLSVSSYRVDDLVRDVEKALGARLVADTERRDQIANDTRRIREDSRRFFSGLHMLRFETLSSRGSESRVRVRPRDLAGVSEDGSMLVAALEALEADVALAKDVPEDVLALGRRANELKGDLRFLLRADDSGFVYFLETRGRGVFLRASPIDVSSTIRDLLLERMDATILTSATLTVDGGFDYVKGRLGIGRATELKLDSEFDYGRQAILYLPQRIPDPRQPAFVTAAAREIVRILELTSGRAFVLFTSYANLREVHRLAAAELEYPILVQGTAPRSALLRDFKATPHAVLLATSSFWQGVDVVGEALSCVIIDKLPFASPGDPITAARVEAITARGGSAFGDYQIPLAILALRQGLGRLLRHRQDRGVLAVLDPRLKTMAYGRRFLASLPPAPVTQDLFDIARFFGANGTDDGGD